ncbi:MAG: right-handed parallel beta-helix repeat-containing protein [Planctomycetes bacterium]|nr:right-handed parallel beta-helix repeat-containing protein [Planctomycetota bacterium]
MSRRLVLPLVLLCLAVAGTLSLTARTAPPDIVKAPTGNVRERGAKGNGTNDDSIAIQDAVDVGAGVVSFPPGTYRITKTIVIDLAKTGFTAIRGEGAVRVVMAGEGPAFKFIGTHTSNADPKNVKEAVWAKERMPSIESVEIVGDHENADGVEATGTMQLTITRMLIRKCRHGVHLTTRNRNVIIADSHIYENRGVGIFMDAINLHQINVIGCHVSYCDDGGIVVKAGEVRNLQITGCDIESNQGEKRPPTANILVESTGGSNAEVAITGNTIQHNHKAPGGANIRIKGPSARAIKDTTEMRDGHVTISGNIISDVMVNIHLQHARGVVITGNTCWTAYEWNLLAENSTAVTVGANNFDRNPRYAAEEKPETTNALMFRDCQDCTLSGFTVSGTRAAPAGLTLERCSRFNVTGLTILDCNDVGMLLTDVTKSRVSDCLIRDDRPDAKSISLRTRDGRDNMIVDNYLGQPHDILKGVGLVERNYDAKVKP